MGAQPSKPAMPSFHEKAVLERLRRLQLEEQHDDEDYVDVGGGAEKGGQGRIVREPVGLPVAAVAGWQTSALQDPKNRLALTALSSADPQKVLTSLPAQIADQQVFNTKIPFEGGPITNQRSSGRCWLFASTNVFRVALMKRYNLESFELSQAYLFYWDKLEKANWFLEQIIDTAGADLEGRLVQRLMGDIASDGGQWDMVVNLVDKYGLVPQALYPDSWNAMNSGVLNAVVRTKLREFGLRLRDMCSADPTPAPAVLTAAKVGMMREISLVMTLLLGPTPDPAEAFTWQYADKDGKAHELKTTPRDFAKDISSSEFRITSSVISSMISLVHDPRHETLTLMTVSRLGNIVGGRPVTYINVPVNTLKAACVKMIKAGLPVFFGCDVGKFSDRASGVMDLDLYDYELGLGLPTGMVGLSKRQRLLAGDSQMTHAMVLTAVHVDATTGETVRWRVQNSWGADSGEKGWFVMSDEWMDEFVYQAVVDPRFVSREVRDVLKQEPLVLPLWDPMGALA